MKFTVVKKVVGKEVFKDFQFFARVLGNKFQIVQIELYYSYVLIFYPN